MKNKKKNKGLKNRGERKLKQISSKLNTNEQESQTLKKPKFILKIIISKFFFIKFKYFK